MTKRKSLQLSDYHRAPVTIKAGDQIMLGGAWIDVTGVEDTQIHWKNAQRAGTMPLHMVKQSMVRPGDPLPEVADDADCQAVAAALGSLGKHFAKVVPDDDRERAGVILRVRGKDDHTVALPPSLKVVGSGEGWRAVKLTDELPQGEPQPMPEFITDPGDLTTEAINTIIDEVADDLSDDEDVSEQVMDTQLLGEDELISADAWDRKQFELDNADDELDYRKGDKLHAANGITYSVRYAGEKILRVDFEMFGVAFDAVIKQADVPKLVTARQSAQTPTAWDDETVRLSAELIKANEHIRELQAQLVQAAASVEMIALDQHEIESFTLPPVDLFNVNLRQERDRVLANLRNSGWSVPFESAMPVITTDDPVRMYHTARLERPKKEATPGERSAIDQATAHVDAIIGLDEPETVIEGVDAQPVALRSAGEFPITAAIRASGVEAVKNFYNTQLCQTFGLARATTRTALTPGGQS